MWTSSVDRSNFLSESNAVIQGKAEVVPDKGICPDLENVFPTTGYIGTFTHEIILTP